VVNVAMVKPLYAAATALVLGASSLAAQQVLGWNMRAPVPQVAGDGHSYRFFGVVETGGRVTAVRRPDGRPDREAEAAIAAAE
jgi:hypothetical protein